MKFIGRIALGALVATAATGWVSAQGAGSSWLPDEVAARCRELATDPQATPATRNGAKKLLDEFSRSGSRFRWDMKTPPGDRTGARATADCPDDPVQNIDTFKKGWGARQLIAVNERICELLDDWALPPLLALSQIAKIDFLIGMLLHELDHAERGPYRDPLPPRQRAAIEVPAHCRQIELYWDLLYRPPYSHLAPDGTWLYLKHEGHELRAFIHGKEAQKEVWRSRL